MSYENIILPYINQYINYINFHILISGVVPSFIYIDFQHQQKPIRTDHPLDPRIGDKVTACVGDHNLVSTPSKAKPLLGDNWECSSQLC